MNFLRSVVVLFCLAFCGAGHACSGDDCAGSLAYQAYGQTGGQPRAIAVFLHGAVSAGGAADYMYDYARRFADAHPQVVSVALLAPGYYDRNGKRSAGSDAGRRLSDDTDALIGALQALRAKFRADRIIVVGHSKGGMNLGGILGKAPGLISGAVLVAGIYDLQSLAVYRNRPQAGIQGIDLVDRIAKSTRIVLVHGDSDRDVPIAQSLAFDEKARAAGLDSKVVVLPGATHSWGGVLASTAMTQLGSLVE